jgi:hypothetical protein
MPIVPGPIMQNGFVVEDLDRAIDHWTLKLGVGPFYVLDHVQFDQLLYRGTPSPLDMTGALAYWGDLQIELILQHNDAPSTYREFLGRGLRGLHHMGMVTHDIERDLARFAAAGFEPVQQGQVAPRGARFAYIDCDAHPGGILELIEAAPDLMNAFATIRAASHDWDGRDPIRKF